MYSALLFQKESIQILDIEKWQPLPSFFSLFAFHPPKKIEEGARKINGPHGTYFEKKMANPESFKTYSPVLNIQKGA